MTIELNGKMHVHGMWFCGNEKEDWMCCLYLPDDSGWTFKYRFRYHADNDPFSLKDKKSWYSGSSKGRDDTTRDQFLSAVADVMGPLMEARYGTAVQFVELDCRGDDPKIQFEMACQDWGHIKQGKDAEAYMEQINAEEEGNPGDGGTAGGEASGPRARPAPFRRGGDRGLHGPD